MAEPTFTDTHCHIQQAQYGLQGDDGVRTKWLEAGKSDPDDLLDAAHQAGVQRLICVGTGVRDSQLAVQFVSDRQNTWASIGIHPHEADSHLVDKKMLEEFEQLVSKPKVVAIGECGLDYFYGNSSKQAQATILRFQIELALTARLPLIFHVREAFADFWKIFDSYTGLRGVVHSFTAGPEELEQALVRGLYIGLNGIMTFTKEPRQLEAAKRVPLASLLLETDAPFLTPAPFRGTICEPKHVRVTAEFLSKLRGEPLEAVAESTTQNAQTLFGLSKTR